MWWKRFCRWNSDYGTKIGKLLGGSNIITWGLKSRTFSTHRQKKDTLEKKVRCLNTWEGLSLERGFTSWGSPGQQNQQDAYSYPETWCKELGDITMEADKSHDLQSESPSWTPMKADGLVQAQGPAGLRPKKSQYLSLCPKARKKPCASSKGNQPFVLLRSSTDWTRLTHKREGKGNPLH